MSESILITSIHRLSDSLPLASGAEAATQTDEYRGGKNQMNKILASLKNSRDSEAMVPFGNMYVLYYIQGDVVFAALFNRGYSQQMAQAYLLDVKREFLSQYDERRVANASVAYAFMSFEGFISKTKRVFEQNKTSRNLSAVQGNLSDIHRVMTKSLADVVNRGDDISDLGSKTDAVLSESESYRKASVDLNRMKFWQKWGVVIVIVLVLLLLFYLRAKLFVYN